MTQDQETRLENFEKMYEAVTVGLEDAANRMAQLKRQRKQNSATYKQLMVQKMTYKNILDMYRLFDIE